MHKILNTIFNAFLIAPSPSRYARAAKANESFLLELGKSAADGRKARSSQL